jgi:hypothetical protein
MLSFADIQKKMLDVQERKLQLVEGKERSRAKKIELKRS